MSLASILFLFRTNLNIYIFSGDGTVVQWLVSHSLLVKGFHVLTVYTAFHAVTTIGTSFPQHTKRKTVSKENGWIGRASSWLCGDMMNN